ncbi:hypothetical protein B0J15DRAFT_599833 [Fusarium solani]|uniref:CFEM domain-containing protein n=1 Tax=Fusarium solani TaxID=169388 RepID=A0A9P9G0D6_FUSSL|nr:uncharacterized protein B0J15DRAFT_599833 [Fusarium solani]KAH7228620.1 hypothetical protein B0J15DRAFT_599833 [Fusarium solani]
MNFLPTLLVGLFVIFPAWCHNTTELPGLPDCAQECFATGISNSTCGFDVQCLCADEAFKEHVHACVEQSCFPVDAFATMNATSTACNAPIRDRRRGFDILTITLIVVTSIVVGLRFFERLRNGSRFNADDYAIIFCLAVDIANSVVCIHGLSPNGLGKDAWVVGPGKITGFLRSLYVGQALYAAEVFAVKPCVLLFYLRIFPGVLIRRLIWGTLVFSVVGGVVFVVLALAQCQPVSYYWQGWDGRREGHCLGINKLAWAIAAVSIALDFWMLGLPLSQLIRLQMHWKRKVAVASMFCVGTFVTVVSILRLRFLITFGNSPNPTWDGYPTCYWSIIELNVAICCACMPDLRLLLLRVFPRAGGSSASRLTGGQSQSFASRKNKSKDKVPPDHLDHNLEGLYTPNSISVYRSKVSVDRSSTMELVDIGSRTAGEKINPI